MFCPYACISDTPSSVNPRGVRFPRYIGGRGARRQAVVAVTRSTALATGLTEFQSQPTRNGRTTSCRRGRSAPPVGDAHQVAHANPPSRRGPLSSAAVGLLLRALSGFFRTSGDLSGLIAATSMPLMNAIGSVPVRHHALGKRTFTSAPTWSGLGQKLK